MNVKFHLKQNLNWNFLEWERNISIRYLERVLISFEYRNQRGENENIPDYEIKN